MSSFLNIGPLNATTPVPDTPTPAPAPPPKRSVYRVNYYVRGQVRSAFVCAFSLDEAAVFLGVRDGSGNGSSVAGPVEVVGLDLAHDALPMLPVTIAESAPQQLSAAEIAAVRSLIKKGE